MTNNSNEFLYPRYGVAGSGARLMALITVLAVVASVASLIHCIVTRNFVLVDWTYGVMLPLFIAHIGVMFCNLYPNVYTSNHGLKVQVFLIWRKVVPWSDVLDIVALDSYREGKFWLVLTKRLTPFHRLIGLYFGKVNLPGFLISKEMASHEELVKTIKEHLPNQTW